MRFGNVGYRIGKITSSELQGLANVLIFQLGILPQSLGTIGIQGRNLDNAANCQPRATNTRLPVHLRWIHRYTIKPLHVVWILLTHLIRKSLTSGS